MQQLPGSFLQKKLLSKIWQNSQKNSYAGVSFLIELQAVGLTGQTISLQIFGGCFPKFYLFIPHFIVPLENLLQLIVGQYLFSYEMPFLLNKVKHQPPEAVIRKFFKMGVLKNFANFKGKHLCWSTFLITKRL